MKTNELKASEINAERLQTRAATDSSYVDEIAERMSAGDVFPPITVFSDGKESWLPDGIHRLEGAIKAKKKIAVDERNGTRADAIEFALGANASHGMRRSNADKRHAVTLALSEFPARSSRAIAELCGVGHHFVEGLRKDDSGGRAPSSNGNGTGQPHGSDPGREAAKRVGRDGKSRTASRQDSQSKHPSVVSFNPAELETERDPAPAIDEWGAPIQQHAKKAFEAVPRFDEILKLLRSASRLYTQLAEHDGGKLLQQSGISINGRSGFRHSGIVNAIRDLKNCRPAYTICPYSVNENQKHAEDCTLCHGLNWSPKFASDRVPERLISKARGFACSI